MDIAGRTIWQHAAGDHGHNHVGLCLKYDVILTGLSFPADMKEGDLVLLKRGTSNVHGVGVLGANIHWEEACDVDGWNLGDARRVRWVWRNERDPKDFHRALTRATTRRLGPSQPAIREWIAGLEDSDADSELAPLPDGGADMGPDAIAAFLFQRGVASDSIRGLLDPHGEFVQMAKWYSSWHPWTKVPSERETVAHLVVPLLRILGWPPQRIAVEATRMDVALYSSVRKWDRQNISAVLEAKKVREPCFPARRQAEGYAASHPSCRRIIVTDGLRYGVFLLDSDSGIFRRHAYLNLYRPRTKYPIYDDCPGAAEALWAMTPEWSPDES